MLGHLGTARQERAAHKPVGLRESLSHDPRQRRAKYMAGRFRQATCAAAAVRAEQRGLVGVAELWHLAALAAVRKVVPDA